MLGLDHPAGSGLPGPPVCTVQWGHAHPHTHVHTHAPKCLFFLLVPEQRNRRTYSLWSSQHPHTLAPSDVSSGGYLLLGALVLPGPQGPQLMEGSYPVSLVFVDIGHTHPVGHSPRLAPGALPGSLISNILSCHQPLWATDGCENPASLTGPDMKVQQVAKSSRSQEEKRTRGAFGVAEPLGLSVRVTEVPSASGSDSQASPSLGPRGHRLAVGIPICPLAMT